MNICVTLIMLAKITAFPSNEKKGLSRLCSATRSSHDCAPRRDLKTGFFATDFCSCHQILGTNQQTPHLPLICHAARASRPGLAVGILRVLCNGMCTAPTWTAKNKGAELDALMNRILSHTTTSALFSTISSLLLGEMLQSNLVEAICFTTSSL